MGSPEQSDNISAFPNRRTIDSISSSLDNLTKLDQIEEVAETIINHPNSTPVHYANLLPAIRASLANTDSEEFDLSLYPNILAVLRRISDEAHPSFVRLRKLAHLVVQQYFDAPRS